VKCDPLPVDGLAHPFRFTADIAEMHAKLVKRLLTPASGRREKRMGEVMQEAFREASAEALTHVTEPAAAPPLIYLESAREAVLSGTADLVFTVTVHVLPKVQVPALGDLRVTVARSHVTTQMVQDQHAAVARMYPGHQGEALARAAGFRSVSEMDKALRSQLSMQLRASDRFRRKEALMEKLADLPGAEAPVPLVQREFVALWGQVNLERLAGELSPEDAAKSEYELMTDCLKMAERRVRAAAALVAIGKAHKVELSEQDIEQAIRQEVARQPAGERAQKLAHLQNHPAAVLPVIATIWEEVVVDLILGVKPHERFSGAFMFGAQAPWTSPDEYDEAWVYYRRADTGMIATLPKSGLHRWKEGAIWDGFTRRPRTVDDPPTDKGKWPSVKQQRATNLSGFLFRSSHPKEHRGTPAWILRDDGHLVPADPKAAEAARDDQLFTFGSHAMPFKDVVTMPPGFWTRWKRRDDVWTREEAEERADRMQNHRHLVAEARGIAVTADETTWTVFACHRERRNDPDAWFEMPPGNFRGDGEFARPYAPEPELIARDRRQDPGCAQSTGRDANMLLMEAK